MKLQKDNNGRYHLTIPRAIAEGRQWEKGDRFTFNIKSNGVLEIVNQDKEVEE